MQRAAWAHLEAEVFEDGHVGGKCINIADPMIRAGVIKAYGEQGNSQAARQVVEHRLI